MTPYKSCPTISTESSFYTTPQGQLPVLALTITRRPVLVLPIVVGMKKTGRHGAGLPAGRIAKLLKIDVDYAKEFYGRGLINKLPRFLLDFLGKPRKRLTIERQQPMVNLVEKG